LDKYRGAIANDGIEEMAGPSLIHVRDPPGYDFPGQNT
jgi:hypothetical protein